MKTFFDASAFAKRFIDHPGSDEIESLSQEASEIGLSVICYSEVISALSRRLREKDITQSEYAAAKTRLSKEWADVEIINISPGVIEKATWLLETNVLRGMDALHVACALEWRTERFVTSDNRQKKAALYAGLNIKFNE